MFVNHSHTFPHGAWPEQPELGTLPELARFMAEAGIERTCAIAPFWGPKTAEMLAGKEINAWLLRNLLDYPQISGLVTVSLKAPQACELLEQYVRAGFIGVKTHPPVMGSGSTNPPVTSSMPSRRSWMSSCSSTPASTAAGWMTTGAAGRQHHALAPGSEGDHRAHGGVGRRWPGVLR
jgi:hypothetical protein